ncbi:ROK family protein [Cetobacterium sp. ZWU0022]|uniref:ROK family protein n=1 Tax=Cetobacterium sp. ZWU0022 TaxID=1340502 RepID=UPI000646ADFC|nr:ROK family protein [Cetobacterium sp. ZWU0022]
MVKGMNLENLKNNNKIAILSYLNKNGESSRKKIAEGLNLTTATLTILTNELIEEGIVVELGALTEGKVGRKQILIDIKKESKLVVGIEISKNSIHYNLIDLKTNIVENLSWKYEKPFEENFFKNILGEILRTLKDRKELLLGVGVTVYGSLSENDIWEREVPDIKKIVEEEMRLPVFIQNNIRALALTEEYLNKAERDFWLVKYGPGVGAAIIMNGELVEGNKRLAGDIGHISFESGEEICRVCGQIGCLESEVNFEKLLKEFEKEILIKNPIQEGEKDSEYILRLINTSKTNEMKLEKALQKIGKAISIGASILDSNKIILAGDILENFDLFKILQENILKNSLVLKNEDIIFMEEYVEKRKKSAGILVLKNFYNC